MSNNIAPLINLLITTAKYDVAAHEQFKGFGEIKFVGIEGQKIYYNTLDKLYASNHEIESTITLERYERELIHIVTTFKKENKICSQTDVTTFNQTLLQIPNVESEILYELFGAVMNCPDLEFGDFTVYNYEKSYDTLILKYPDLNSMKDVFFGDWQPKLLIGIKVKAREQSKAIELADKLCESFENVFSYVISDLNHKLRISILSYNERISINRIIGNTKAMGIHMHNKNLITYVNLEDTFFKRADQGYDKVWGLITKDRNDIEKRIFIAIEWVGKAVQEIDKSKSLVQFIFAIEAMLQPDKREFVSPSIVSQLSEWSAFIINDEKEKRKEIAKYFKDLYSIRSAIAHGASKEVSMDSLQIALQIIKLIILAFLTQEPYKNMQKFDELQNVMTDLKFS
ncbi:MAG: HEPN domain-containing protein [Parachlamydiaceae bacterium]|nr:HEPN domain-containing protein [Parachlamydiaceae bacterium]